MSESISSWLVRAAGTCFVMTFLGSIWQESLKVQPTRADLDDARWEIAATANTQWSGPNLKQVGVKGGAAPGFVATINARPTSSFRKGLSRYVAMQSARRSRQAKSSSLPR